MFNIRIRLTLHSRIDQIKIKWEDIKRIYRMLINNQEDNNLISLMMMLILWIFRFLIDSNRNSKFNSNYNNNKLELEINNRANRNKSIKHRNSSNICNFQLKLIKTNRIRNKNQMDCKRNILYHLIIDHRHY